MVLRLLHPKTIAPIAQFQIPCLIKNSFSPQGAGTLIGQDTGEDNLAIKGITTLSQLNDGQRIRPWYERHGWYGEPRIWRNVNVWRFYCFNYSIIIGIQH